LKFYPISYVTCYIYIAVFVRYILYQILVLFQNMSRVTY